MPALKHRTSELPSTGRLLAELAARPAAERLPELFRELAALELTVSELQLYHELLLFYKAYPPSLAVRAHCSQSLNVFHRKIATLPQASRRKLDQTGIVGTRVFYRFDYSNIKWLEKQLRGGVDIDWREYDRRERDQLAEILPSLLTAGEIDACDDSNIGTCELVDAARGNQSKLQWLLRRMESKFAQPILEELYNSLDLPVVATLGPEGPSRTLAEDGDPVKVALFKPDEKQAPLDFHLECSRPLKIPEPVPPQRGRELLNLVHASLLPRLRELYPMTYGNPAEVYDVSLERGIRVVFWMMIPERRLPLEVGWDFLILKNNVPIGYGGGGFTHDRTEHAVNIFETFRGREAVWLFAQITRVAVSLNRVPWIVVRRFQLGGEGNEEGITSGSYWFYDKLGFRSVNADLRKIADEERRKIHAKKGYRTPRRILRKLAQSDVVLSLDGRAAGEYREMPLGNISLLVSRMIARRYGGDRSSLVRDVLNNLRTEFGLDSSRWSATEKSRGALMAILLLAIPNFSKWSRSKQVSAFELCRLKGSAREADYARAMNKNLKFFEAMVKQCETSKVSG